MKNISLFFVFVVGFWCHLFGASAFSGTLDAPTRSHIDPPFVAFIAKVDMSVSSIDAKIQTFEALRTKIREIKKFYHGERWLIIDFLEAKIQLKIEELKAKKQSRGNSRSGRNDTVNASGNSTGNTGTGNTGTGSTGTGTTGTGSTGTGSTGTGSTGTGSTGTGSTGTGTTGTGTTGTGTTGTGSTSVSPFLERNTIIVRTPENFVHRWAAQNHLELFRDKGIKTIILLVKNDEDLAHMDSGELFYSGTLAPIAQDYQTWNFDALEYTIDFAHNNDMKVYAWLPQFHDKVVINNNPANQMMYLSGTGVAFYNPNGEYFANPVSSTVQDHQIAIIEEVTRNYDIDGLFIDWVRFDGYAMDMSQATRDKFQDFTGIDALTIDFTTDNTQRQAWNNFRQDEIATYIHRVSDSVKAIKPDLELGAFVLPVEMKEVAQNPSKFEEYLDYIGVMLYNADWGYPEEWIYTTATQDIKNALTDDSKILAVLDIPSCENAQITAELVNTGVLNTTCFYYYDWTEQILDRILP